MASFNVEPLPGPFGAMVRGLDMRQPMDHETEKALIDAFLRHQFIVVRDQDLSFDHFDRLTQSFGRQKPHFLDHLRLHGHPAILLLSNVFDGDRPMGVYEGAAFWHTDVAYEHPPNSATVVYALEVPDGGCPTEFADCYTAYDDLPQNTRELIDDLTVVHHYGNRWDMDENSPTSAERLTAEQKRNVRNVRMPLVRRHHVTGRPALYGTAGSSFGIVGWPEDEAVALLDELARHCIQEKYLTSWDYTVGDVAAWDTFATLHKAQVQQPAQAERDRRMLWRVSVTGKPRVYENSAAA